MSALPLLEGVLDLGHVTFPSGLVLGPPPRAKQYQVLYPDAPWPENGGGKTKRGANRHYGTMKVRDIIKHFQLFGSWAADDAHIYAWATNNYMPAALECIAAAGFRYVSMITWVKDTKGLGQYYRGRTEHCLFGVRGRLPYRILASGKRAQGETVLYYPEPDELDIPHPEHLPSAFEAPRQRENGKVKHSRKPPQMLEYIERVSGNVPSLELYARYAAPGWDAWGNQAPSVAG